MVWTGTMPVFSVDYVNSVLNKLLSIAVFIYDICRMTVEVISGNLIGSIDPCVRKSQLQTSNNSSQVFNCTNTDETIEFTIPCDLFLETLF